MERKAEEARPRQPGCPLPFQPVRGTTPTPSRGCGAGEGGGGLCKAVVFHFTFVDPGGKRERPRTCSAPSPEPRVRSVPAAGLGTEPAECPKRSRALGTCPAASRRASRAGRGCLALALPRSPRARRPETGGAGELEMPVAEPPRSAPDPGFCRSGGEYYGQWI